MKIIITNKGKKIATRKQSTLMTKKQPTDMVKKLRQANEQADDVIKTQVFNIF
jgi:hypothetical protein